MSWHDYRLARQLVVERHIGTRIREAQAVEKEQARASRKVLDRRR